MSKLGIVSFVVATVLFTAALFLLASLIASLTDLSYSRALKTFSEGTYILLLLGGIGWMVVSKLRAGPVLLDMKAMFPGRHWLVAGTVSWLFISSLDFDFENIWSFLGSQTVSLLLVFCLVIFASGRFQVRERGIWFYIALLPWHKIEAYALQDGRVYFKTKFWVSNPDAWAKEGYTVPEAHVEVFEACLLEHNIPKQQNTAIDAASIST